MKKTHIIYIIGFWLCCVPFLAHTAQEKENTLKVVYVSINETMEKTGEQNKIRMALEKEKKRIRGIVVKKNEQFNKTAMKIKKEMALLSENEKAKKYSDLQKMQLQMEQFLKEKEIEFQKKEASLRRQAIEKIKGILDQVAKQEKVDVIRNKDGTLWVHSKWDLTSKVIRIYKKKYK